MSSLDHPTLEDTPRDAPESFVVHARLIGALTFISRILGMARESVAARYFGANPIWAAFTVAFTIPNLFRKLFGEGALSAAFIPLYAQEVKRDGEGTASPASARFAAAAVNLLTLILIVLTIVGELAILGIGLTIPMAPDRMLALKLTALMLPYVLLVCGQAFLGGILQVHHRFAIPAITAIVLNAILIAAIIAGAQLFDLGTDAGRVSAVYLLSLAVLVAGVIQILLMIRPLRAVGFRFRLMESIWTPPIRRMLTLTLPVALSAGVMQISVLLDKGISFFLAEGVGTIQHQFHLFGMALDRYPMAAGAAARLNWAQFMYQFPLGVFAIALATAIFPKLSAEALETGQDSFKAVLRRGIESCLFIALPASVGMIVVRYPAVRLLFQHGEFTPEDTRLVALSTALYSGAIWAFSLQQILNRAYYALHDTTTPLVLGMANLAVNTLVELPLLWTGLTEAAMALGTLVAFSLQSVLMLWMLNRRLGGLGLSRIAAPIAKMIAASALMWLACWAIQHTPLFALRGRALVWAAQLAVLMAVGGGVYFIAMRAMGIKPRSWRGD